MSRMSRILILLGTFPAYLAYRKSFLASPYGALAIGTGAPSLFLRKYSAPYLSKRLSAKHRLLGLAHHVAFVNSRFPQNSFEWLQCGSIFLGPGNSLSCAYTFRLDLPFRGQLKGSSCWEGDLRLECVHRDEKLHSMTFSFLPSTIFDGQNEPVLFIGGSQSSGDRMLRREAALMNQDIHPSTATLIALKGLAEVLGVRRLLAVKARDQVTIHQRPGHHEVAYDDFWLAQHDIDQGKYFELPLAPSPDRAAAVGGSHGARTRKRRIARMTLKQSLESQFRLLLADHESEFVGKNAVSDSLGAAHVLKFPTILGGISGP